jgi:AraC-like DNA-binding protein
MNADMAERELKLRRLLRLVETDSRPQGWVPPDAPPSVASFIARRTERIAEMKLGRAAMILVLEGGKELVQAGHSTLVGAGQAVTLAAGWRGTVVNEPASRSGVYRALYVDFPPDLIVRARRAHPDWPRAQLRSGHACAVATLTPTLVESVLHLCDALLPERLAPHLVEHRAMEILLILVDQGALPIAPIGRPEAVTDAVKALLRWRPSHRWTADEIGRSIGLSNATLRRRLGAEGTSLRDLLSSERMAHARQLIASEGATIAEAAHAAGYESRSRFSRRYKEVFGAPPSATRRRFERIGHETER